jgi:hypothetical protein
VPKKRRRRGRKLRREINLRRGRVHERGSTGIPACASFSVAVAYVHRQECLCY